LARLSSFRLRNHRYGSTITDMVVDDVKVLWGFRACRSYVDWLADVFSYAFAESYVVPMLEASAIWAVYFS